MTDVLHRNGTVYAWDDEWRARREVFEQLAGSHAAFVGPPQPSYTKSLAKMLGHLCAICGQPLSHHRRTMDHVWPRGKGGQNLHNRVIAHEHCNSRKGDRLPTGCELVCLMAVNAGMDRLYTQHPPRTNMKARAKKARRRARELVALKDLAADADDV